MDRRADRAPEAEAAASAGHALARLLKNFSVEITSHDAEAATGRLAPGAEVFVANPPKEGVDTLVAAAARLHRAGLIPVPHIVARKLRDARELDHLVGRLAGDAGVGRVLALGGDRDSPVGAFDASLQLIETGVFERHGVRQVSIACYPEGHPRIPDAVLQSALRAKLAAVAERGIEARLVSQFGFAPEPVIAMARRLRAAGISAPLRIGVAGPAQRAKLVRYAMHCGVGASLRALTGHRSLVGSLVAGETPEALLTAVALVARDDPSLGIEGVHFFTFGAPEKSIVWAESRME